MQHQNQKGFTLVELMVVVAIAGILLTLAIPAYQGQRSAVSGRAGQSRGNGIASGRPRKTISAGGANHRE